MPAKRFDFANAQGEKLAALLDRPDGPIRAVALFAHCFTCGKDNKAAQARANSPTPHSRQTPTILLPRPITCGRRSPRLRF